MSRLAAVKDLTEKVDSGLKGTEERAPGSIAVKRALFGVFAEQWNDADEAGDTEALEALQALRPRLKFRPPKQALLSKVFMYFRLLLTVLVASWGCMCVLMLAPLRWANPLFKACGLTNGWLPMDLCMTLWGRAVLAASGVRVRLEGESASEKWGVAPCGVIIYNHTSNLDPFIVSHICSCVAPKYLGKKTLFKFPFFGWMSLAVGMVPINRGDRAKAVATMNQSVGKILRKGRCVAISPEGTRTTDGHLALPFKKGTFHLQEQTGAPLLPVVIHGAYELWPPGQLFAATGEVTVRILAEQPLRGDTASREASRLALQRSLANCMARHSELGAKPLSPTAALECLLTLLGTLVVFRQFWLLYSSLIAAAGLSVSGVVCLFIAVTGAIAAAVEQFL